MIHISGSIAYDRIMTFPGKFEDHILPEKLHILNVSFQVDKVVERRGGTAGNIAYSLALLGEKPLVYSAVGKDFTEYAKAFDALGLTLATVDRDENNFTASCYITTDLVANQIAAFSPAAMLNSIKPAFFPKADADSDWAIVSPGNTEDMLALPRYYAKLGIRTVYDPGQQIIVLSPESMLEAISTAQVVVGNDYEIAKIQKTLNLTAAQMKEKVQYVITTYGEKGSAVDSKDFDKPVMIKPATPVCVTDPTGAGDAYRAGVLKGLHSGLDIVVAAQLGTVCASFCVEQNGTQEHHFTKSIFIERFEKHFGVFPEINW